jgi:hypothetical protein
MLNKCCLVLIPGAIIELVLLNIELIKSLNKVRAMTWMINALVLLEWGLMCL